MNRNTSAQLLRVSVGEGAEQRTFPWAKRAAERWLQERDLGESPRLNWAERRRQPARAGTRAWLKNLRFSCIAMLWTSFKTVIKDLNHKVH